MNKVHYLSPGPSQLPSEVRSRIHEELLDTFGIGVSVMEISHRSPHYDAMSSQTLQLIKDVLQVPDTHVVLLTPFGAQQHFSLVLQNLTIAADTVAYTDTGVWAHLAVLDAANSGRNMRLVYDGNPDYKSLGNPSEWDIPSESRFVHLTINNTVYGTEYPVIPTFGNIPLVLDMTSSIAARSDIPWAQTGLIYASAQKNFGIAGVSIVIVRKDLLEASREITKRNKLGNALCYHAIADAKSALNTPPVFSIYVANRMFQWMQSVGGLATMELWAKQKADMIYKAVDSGAYVGRCAHAHRSRHNFVFELNNTQDTARFIDAAAKRNILEIKGYRSTGGIRASLYNGVSLHSAEIFAQFLKEFR